MRLLALGFSPRRNGNSETLLRAAAQAAKAHGATVELALLENFAVAPCNGCEECRTTGRCVIDDDFHDLVDRLLACDRLLVATPLWFLSVPAQAKALIDRTQSLWARRVLLKQPLFRTLPRTPRLAAFVAVGGSSSRRGFEPLLAVLRAFLVNLETRLGFSLLVSGLDDAGPAAGLPAAVLAAQELGERLVDPRLPAPARMAERWIDARRRTGGHHAGR